jgi:hypothetical protein
MNKIKSFQEEVISDALLRIKEMRQRLDAIERCLVESKGFPVYLSDLLDDARSLGYLAVRHKAASDIKSYK